MNEPQTCGKGLAEHSALPAKLSELAAAMAENLEAHQKTLDVADGNSRKELHVYVKLAREFRSIATQLKTTAEHMAGYWDLPMGRHDQRAMARREVLDAFTKFLELEGELLELLRQWVERDGKMLAAIRAA
jgi:hypothetical protein